MNEWLHKPSGVNHVPVQTLLSDLPPARRSWVDIRDHIERKWPDCIVIERGIAAQESDKAISFVRFLRENSIEFQPWTSFVTGPKVVYFFTNAINAVQFKLWMG